MSGSSAMQGASRAISDGLAKLSVLGLIAGLAAGLGQIAAGPGRQLGLWDHSLGFKILEWAGYVGLAAAGASLIGMFAAWGIGRRKLIVLGLIGAVVGAGVAYWPWALQKGFRAPPPLYDITTDLADPPRFVAALELRKGARLPAEYPPSFASQQEKAYPDITPLRLTVPPGQAFERALSAARDMGWRVHAAVPAEGRIEAVAKTFWFGFEDDVVVRVAAAVDGSRIDVRSTGRLGRRDGGTNARRVQAYLKRLNAGG